MAATLGSTPGLSLTGALGPIDAIALARPMTAPAAVTPHLRDRNRENVPIRTASSLVHTLGVIAIGLNVLITIINVGALFAYPEYVGPVAVPALLLASLTLPLHLRHVVYELRGERPPAGAWTLALMVVANAAGFLLVGPPWLLEFASLAVSILIVVRGKWALVMVAAVMLSPVVLVRQSPPFLASPTVSLAVTYLVLAIIWRAVTQFVPIRLAGTIRKVEAARRELEARAVIRERMRIDDELHEGIGARLQEIIAHGENALAAAASKVEIGADTAVDELRRLVVGSRGALTEARRIVAGYQTPTMRDNLSAAVALLETSGASVRVAVADDLPLDTPDDQFRLQVRDALMHALRGEPSAAYLLEVTGAGDTLNVSVSPENANRKNTGATE